MKYFEDEPVSGATIADIDLDFVGSFIKRIGYEKGDAECYLRHNHDFITAVDGKDKVSVAAILLFGNNPQRFFPRARIRFIKYEGRTAEVGDRMNVVKDVKFSGRIIDQVQDAIAFVKTQIREYTKLGKGAVFITDPEFPEFCWTELIVNAAAHRDYSIKGTDIQIKMFDDHFVVESPGILPGLVRVNNIREFHFSRNPKIVELLNEYDMVKEFGEGVDRIYRDMEDAGLPAPIYRQTEFMLYAELRNKYYEVDGISWILRTQDWGHDERNDVSAQNDFEKLVDFCSEPRSRKDMMAFMGVANRDHFTKHYLTPLLESERIKMTIPDKPTSSKQRYIKT